MSASGALRRFSVGRGTATPGSMRIEADTNEGDLLLSTQTLLSRARAGDPTARGELCARFTPILRRFLHRRLCRGARGQYETQDLVQEVQVRALARLGDFEYLGPGSFWSYLRRIGLNLLTEIARRSANTATPPRAELGEVAASGAGPETLLLRKEQYEAFERALATLSEELRRAVLMRLELQLPFKAVAAECGFPTPDAARMAVSRAIETIVQRMSHEHPS